MSGGSFGLADELIRIANRERANHGLAPLIRDDALTRAAQKHSESMRDIGFFSHYSFDGRTVRDRLESEGVTWSYIAENIAQGYESASEAHHAWMSSEGHRANILSDKAHRVGVGCAYSTSFGTYWTQDFAD